MLVPGKEECLLEWVYHRSFATTNTDARWFLRINVEQLRLSIQQSEREAARVAKLKRKQDCIVRRLQGYIIISDSSDDDVDQPPAVKAYTIDDDLNGKGLTRKG
ncbi:hypothetical protein D1007_59543 [Hordeum vulgare]|nr:hypothetical protein D1007_59543 [Hordeum vulgare]